MGVLRVLFVEESDEDIFVAAYRLGRRGVSVDARVVSTTARLEEPVGKGRTHVIVGDAQFIRSESDCVRTAAERLLPGVPLIVAAREGLNACAMREGGRTGRSSQAASQELAATIGLSLRT